jgi:arabinose-5-phosphate isomerase
MLARAAGHGGSILDAAPDEVMTRNPVTLRARRSRSRRCALMEERKITSIVVVGRGQNVEGIVHLHDLWRTQLF